jgi:hypothetical protein
MVDIKNDDAMLLVIDAIPDPVSPSTRSPEARERLAQRRTDDPGLADKGT